MATEKPGPAQPTTYTFPLVGDTRISIEHINANEALRLAALEAEKAGTTFNFAEYTFEASHFRDLEFIDVSFNGASFASENADFYNVVFQRCDLRALNHQTIFVFKKCVFHQCNFSETDVMWVEFEDCEFVECDFGSVVNGIQKIGGCTIRECDFSDANLSGIDFSRSKASNTTFSLANLSRADLRFSSLSKCHFIGSDLSDSLFLPYNLDEGEVMRQPTVYSWITSADKRRLLFTFPSEDARFDERTVPPHELYEEARTDPAMVALTLTLKQFAPALIAAAIGLGLLVYFLVRH